MPAPPGQLKSTQKPIEEEKPKPKPQQNREAESPMGGLMAELAARNDNRNAGPPIRDPVKQNYGVNQSGFGVELKKTPQQSKTDPNFTPKPYTPKQESKPEVKPSYGYGSNSRLQKDPGPKLAWSLSGPEEILAENDVEFRLTCKNAETKASFDYDPRKLESDIWLVSNRGMTISGRILKSNAGLFTLQYGKLNPGSYAMNIWVDKDTSRRALYPEDNPISLDVMSEFTESVGRSINFSCTGAGFNGGEVLKPCTFKIFCKDDNHRSVEIPKEKLKVNLSQPGKVIPATITEVSDGCFTSSFTPQQDGEWKIEILYQGQIVVTNKMVITGRTEGGQCIIQKAPRQVKTNVPSSFIMQARDRMGEVMSSGGEVFKTSVAGPPGGIKDFKVRDEANGTYVVSFTFTKPGEFEFTISLRNKQVDGSPLIIMGVD